MWAKEIFECLKLSNKFSTNLRSINLRPKIRAKSFFSTWKLANNQQEGKWMGIYDPFLSHPGKKELHNNSMVNVVQQFLWHFFCQCTSISFFQQTIILNLEKKKPKKFCNLKKGKNRFPTARLVIALKPPERNCTTRKFSEIFSLCWFEGWFNDCFYGR